MGRPHCCSKEGLNHGAWTSKEDMILSEHIRVHGDGGWTHLPKKAGLKRCGRSCRLRWLNYLRPNIKHGNISPDEEDLIIRMHRLLGNRWSLIAGRLPGRTDNEIKNYWNTHLSKKLLSVNGSQSKSSVSNLKTSSISPPPLKPQEFKSSPIKITTGVIQDEIGRPNSCDGYGCTSRSSDEGFKLFDAKESTNSSTSLCNPLRNDSITDNDSGMTPFAIGDASLVETNMKTSTCSLSDQQPSHSYHFAGDAATFDENFSCLNELSSPHWNLPLSPSYYSTNFLLEEFWAAEINEFENIF